jgi:hypothetical protein
VCLILIVFCEEYNHESPDLLAVVLPTLLLPPLIPTVPSTVTLPFQALPYKTMKNSVFWDVTPSGSCKNNVSEECITSVIRVERISDLGTAIAVTSN